MVYCTNQKEKSKVLTTQKITSKKTEYFPHHICFEIKEGVLHSSYSKEIDIDLQIAQEVVSYRVMYQENQDYPVVAYGEPVNSMTKEARDFFANDVGLKNVTALAIVINNALEKMLGNFYIKVSKPKVPTKLFTDLDSAIDWVKQFR